MVTEAQESGKLFDEELLSTDQKRKREGEVLPPHFIYLTYLQVYYLPSGAEYDYDSASPAIPAKPHTVRLPQSQHSGIL